MSQGVILIPGIMGSVLKDGDELVWPGSPAELLLPYKHMAQLLKPNLQATDVIRSVSISKQYIDILDSLESAGFHERGKPPTLLVFPYDWRKDNAVAAAHLADAVDQFAKPLGAGADITLLAHSMGGLVSRYYVESGLFNNRAGFSSIKRLITMGTPHLGSPLALTAALGQEKRLFLNAQQVKTLANDPHFSALYQLLPPPGLPFVWDRDQHARFAGLDVYAEAVAGPLGLSRENLKSAVQFRKGLNLSRKPDSVSYFCFVGTQQTTINEVQVVLARGPSGADKFERKDAGDGTVPFWSGSLSGLQSVAVSGEHGELYKAGDLKRVLAVLLNVDTLLEAAGDTPEISIRHKVVEPGTVVRVVINFPRDTVDVIAEIRITREVDSAGNVQAPASAGVPVTIRYQGPPLDHLEVSITAPDYAGVYRVAYVEMAGGQMPATTELFVQRTM